ncbi:MAG TPA: hypothetical protein DEF45_03960 [Rhodopirellula sp.]|nr:hypothetical protein [Rhodopirellula sp.]
MSDSASNAAHVDRDQTDCLACGTPLERGDLRCAICGKSAPLGRNNLTTTEVVKILRCTGCGAAVAYDPKKQAPSCSFCDSVVEIETLQDPMEQTGGYLVFTVSAEEAKAQLQQWLSSLGWFRPSDLSATARVQELKPLWWVAWVFDADARVSWAADSNHGGRRSAWAPHAGTAEIVFDDILASASKGLSAAEVEVLASGYDLTTARPNPEGAENATIEQFDVQRSQARKQVAQALNEMARIRVQQSEIPGSKFRKLQVSLVLQNLVTRRLSFPAYVMAYRYKGQLYRLVIGGQNKTLLCGNAPYSQAKIIAVACAVIAALAFILLLISVTQ